LLPKGKTRLNNLPPIKHQVNLIMRRCAIRFNKLPKASPIIQRLPDTWRENHPPSTPPPLPLPQSPQNRNRPKTILQNLAKYTSPDHECINPFLVPPWECTASSFPNQIRINPCNPNSDSKTVKKEHVKLIESFKTKPNVIYIYRDGSKIQRPPFFWVGAAVVSYNEDHEIFNGKLRLGGHAEVYDAEMAALSLGATQATEYMATHPNITHIVLFTDNSAATTAIGDTKPQSAQTFAAKFQNTLTPLLRTHPDLMVSISWCPSHCGIKGNERADKLTKEATHLERQTPYSISRSNAIHHTKSTIVKLWNQDWRKQPPNKIRNLKPVPTIHTTNFSFQTTQEGPRALRYTNTMQNRT
jgi:ribonuclease HI